MKRFIIALTAAAVTMGASGLNAAAASIPAVSPRDGVTISGTTLGDLDGTGTINAVDASKLLALYSEMQNNTRTVSDHEINICDVNGNGKLDAADASMLLTFYADKMTGLDCSVIQYRNYLSARNDVTADRVTRRFDWVDYISGKDTVIEVEFNRASYDYYKTVARITNYRDSGEYLNEENNRKFVRFFADQITSISDARGYDDYNKIHLAAQFVQSIPYDYDINSRGLEDYPKYPIETVFEYRGDCEDVAFFLAGIIREFGYDVAMLLYDDHMALGVAGVPGASGTYYTSGGKDYFYLEATGFGWKLGEIPDGYSSSGAYVYPM